MKKKSLNHGIAFLNISLGLVLTRSAQAQVTTAPPNYTITTPASEYEYVVNGNSSGLPAGEGIDDSYAFSLAAGATYTFKMNTASFHPVDICTNPATFAHYTGASAQAVSSGSVTLTIPAANYPTALYYICDFHSFYGKITITPPQPPPPTTVIKASITTNIVLTFTGGTNTTALVPQFSSNLVTGVWAPVPTYTTTFGSTSSNTFTGTNITIFNRLDAICGPNVFLRIKQVTP